MHSIPSSAEAVRERRASTSLPPEWAEPAARRLPRYTSYPTARDFRAVDHPAYAEIEAMVSADRPERRLSAYVHVPFCRRLCWYCGCNTSVVHDYQRVAEFHRTALDEIDLWTARLGEHDGLAHLHFGGGSPNALAPDDLVRLIERLSDRLSLRSCAEVALELDPALMTGDFAQAAGAAGVTRASLGVQTFDPDVQARINRIQPFDRVAQAVCELREAGVTAINFDLMYGLPAQTPDNVATTAELALDLRPDRLAVFGYAHVPWMKKHQKMIQEDALADVAGRWNQAAAIDAVLIQAGYVRIGLDHYARPEDPLARAAAAGRLRRNFQGYTDDPADVLVPIGPSSIGQFEDGFVQNATALHHWRQSVALGRLPVERRLALTAEDRLRAAVIERLMCDLQVDVAALCSSHGFAPDRLDDALAATVPLQSRGLCQIDGRKVILPEPARRLMRVVAACFDADLPEPGRAAVAI